ncbi:hypothetical protein [Streptomyces sp. NPDC046909]|uniref:hypothetical protein n=1 Tax=Streptomyces sp. NPDC046909 TaxID=3155617 RepID=UPI0033D23320
MIEVRREIGPAAEPHLGRLLHGAIRPGGAGVLVDLRHTADLGAGGIGVLRLARTLADRHGLAFGCVGDVPGMPTLPLLGQSAAVSDSGLSCAEVGAEDGRTCEVGSLRRHGPDQVLEVAVRSIDLPASQPVRRHFDPLS